MSGGIGILVRETQTNKEIEIIEKNNKKHSETKNS